MYKLIIHTKVGTFQSIAITKEGLDETLKMLKDYSGKLTYFTLNNPDDLPMYFAKGILEDSVITVARVPT
jgi:hypothetical protein